MQVLFVSAVLASGGVMAEGYGAGGDGKGRGMAMRHANPMPNLMKVVKKHGDQLNLTSDQSAKLQEWRETHMKPIHAQRDDIKQMEIALNEAALAGKPKAELMVMASKIMNARTDIISTKVDCRDNMRRILSPQQYEKVLLIYAEMKKR